MVQIFKKLVIHTSKKNYLDVTENIIEELKMTKIQNGLLNISILHTSCSLLIQENADPSVLIDIRNFLEDMAPEKKYLHNSI